MKTTIAALVSALFIAPLAASAADVPLIDVGEPKKGEFLFSGVTLFTKCVGRIVMVARFASFWYNLQQSGVRRVRGGRVGASGECGCSRCSAWPQSSSGRFARQG